MMARAKYAQEPDADPMEVFDAIDTNGDGVLSREEFATAVDMMNYEDLLKFKASVSRNELSYNPDLEEDKTLEESGDSQLIRRIKVTMAVAVSKIFPAGFGWQTAATLMDNSGVQGTDLAFFLGTGVGDGLGVFLGHQLYMTAQKAITGDESISLTKEAQTGAMLGSAAIFSGGIWQPCVNALQAAGWGFHPTVAMTTGVATLAFFSGLRLARIMYGPFMAGIEVPTYANLKADAALSFAVGGAAGCFVSTDMSYGAANALMPYLGIQENASLLTGSVLAGTSTAIGFTTVQMAQNVMYPKDKCWVD